MASEQDMQEHGAVLDTARAIYAERDGIRQGLWKDYPPEKQLEQARIKIDRCLNALRLGRPEDVLEEVPDIINYAAFAERLVRKGNWPEPTVVERRGLDWPDGPIEPRGKPAVPREDS